MRSEHAEHRLQHVELELHVLGHGLDHDVCAGAGVACVGGGGETIHRLVPLIRAELALLDELLELRADGLDRAERRVAGLGRDLRDSLTHGPGPEDGHV